MWSFLRPLYYPSGIYAMHIREALNYHDALAFLKQDGLILGSVHY